jgi:hypothetical protein
MHTCARVQAALLKSAPAYSFGGRYKQSSGKSKPVTKLMHVNKQL